MPILLVDDDPDILGLFGMLLSKNGYDVTTASNARDAFRHLLAGQFDAIITDYMMPDFDTADFAKMAALRQIPVILISGVAKLDIAKELPVKRLLCKPVDLDEVLMVLRG